MAVKKVASVKVNENEVVEAVAWGPETKFKTPLKEVKAIELGEYQVAYRKPGVAQMAHMIHWIIEGFAPTFLSAQELDKMTMDEQFEAALQYVTGARTKLTEEQQAKIWGTALFASKASITYLYPVFDQCFPGLSVYEVKDEVLDLCMNQLIQDFFSNLSEGMKLANTPN
jgi:hypothetical protein